MIFRRDHSSASSDQKEDVVLSNSACRRQRSSIAWYFSTVFIVASKTIEKYKRAAVHSVPAAFTQFQHWNRSNLAFD
jgi:hypothetical protein